jgi:hypothetical protein
MAEKNRDYRTGERVPEAGQYACASGDRKEFKTNDNFPACPVSGNDTTWKRD